MKERRSRGPAGRGFDIDLQMSLGYLLRDTSRIILRDLTARLEPHGITLPQYFLLRELWNEEGLTQRELALRVGVVEPTMVTTLDALEKSELVMRARSKQDRRKTHVFLTPQGRGMRDELLGYAAQVIDRGLEGVSDEEIAQVRRILVKIKANLVAEVGQEFENPLPSATLEDGAG